MDMWNKPRGCASFHLWCPMRADGKWIVSHMLTLEQSWTISRQLKPSSLICCKAFRVRGHRLGPTCLSLPPAGALIRTRSLLKNVKNLGAAQTVCLSPPHHPHPPNLHRPHCPHSKHEVSLCSFQPWHRPLPDKRGPARRCAKLTRP